MHQNVRHSPTDQRNEPPSPGPDGMELDEGARETLEEIRREVLASPDFPVPEERRPRLADYELRAAGPDRPSVSLQVEVVRGGIRDDGAAGETVERAVELTPQVLVESPGGLRYFVAWNHVARVFVVWFTPRSLAALRDGRRPDGPGRVLPLADGRSNPSERGESP